MLCAVLFGNKTSRDDHDRRSVDGGCSSNTRDNKEAAEQIWQHNQNICVLQTTFKARERRRNMQEICENKNKNLFNILTLIPHSFLTYFLMFLFFRLFLLPSSHFRSPAMGCVFGMHVIIFGCLIIWQFGVWWSVFFFFSGSVVGHDLWRWFSGCVKSWFEFCVWRRWRCEIHWKKLSTFLCKNKNNNYEKKWTDRMLTLAVSKRKIIGKNLN